MRHTLILPNHRRFTRSKLLQLMAPMLIFITVLILFLTALALVVLRLTQPGFRYFWLTAVGGALLAWLATWLWLVQQPIALALPVWQPPTLFKDSPSFLADGLSWAFAISLSTLGLSVLVTTVARQNYSEPLPWAGTLTLTGLGLLAVTANNPLTLVLVWAAIDLTELITLLRSTDGPIAGERAALAFSTRAAAIGLLLWANGVSIAAGGQLDFVSMPPSAGVYILLAAGLRLGVLPLHLPYPSDSRLRRGFGTTLRMVSAASSLIVLARIPPESIVLPITPLLLILTTLAAMYGGWMWLRAPDELAGRPFWMIGMAGLAIAAALQGNPSGATAWSCGLLLCGSALFLASIQINWLHRVLLLCAWGLSALPYSITASGWLINTGTFWPAIPFLLIAQAFLLTGFIRHTLRTGTRETMDAQPGWVRSVYPAGIIVILLTVLLLGIFGWQGAGQFGALPFGIAASIFSIGLLWAGPRFRVLNPSRAHWLRPTAAAWYEGLFRTFSNFDQVLGRLSRAISSTLEGDGGIMWVLLFLALFVSFMVQGRP